MNGSIKHSSSSVPTDLSIADRLYLFFLFPRTKTLNGKAWMVLVLGLLGKRGKEPLFASFME